MTDRFYAQRNEDRKLIQYLGLNGTAQNTVGTYIDIGAWEPETDSVTKHFYDNGWRGLNVEPIPYYFERLKAERTRDLNLQIGVGSVREQREFTYIEATGLSTFVEDYGQRFSQNRAHQRFMVDVWPLHEIYEEYNIGGWGIIDFMKIDVEGWEREVILGNDWSRLRPRILVIEATVPGTEEPAWDGWDSLVLDAGYDFLEFDGLNRYYRVKNYVQRAA